MSTWITGASLMALAWSAACASPGGEPSPRDAGMATPDAGADVCLEARGTIGPSGGKLTLCDATLVVAAGQLPAEIEFGIQRVDAPPPLPEPFTIVGHAWRFTPDEIGDIGQVRIELAHAADRPLELVRVQADGWEPFGACEQTPTTLSQTTWFELGTFAAITDPRDLPALPMGIGTASAEVTLDGRTMSLQSGTDGFLTDEPGLGGYRTFAMHVTEGPIGLSVEMALLEDGAMAPLFVMLMDAATGETWQMDAFSSPDALRVTATYESGVLTGSAEGSLFGAAGEEAVAVSFAGTPGSWWREPPRICVGEGGV